MVTFRPSGYSQERLCLRLGPALGLDLGIERRAVHRVDDPIEVAVAAVEAIAVLVDAVAVDLDRAVVPRRILVSTRAPPATTGTT
jgi:hypothetical protein